jgi:hypothetical protein
LNKEYGGLRIDPSTNVAVTTSDYNLVTLFSESVCLAESISTFNNTPNCISLSPQSNSSNYVSIIVRAVSLQSSVATDRFKEDTSFVVIPNTLTPGYFYLQPAAAFGSTFYISVNNYGNSISLVSTVTDQTAASFYRTTVYVPSECTYDD